MPEKLPIIKSSDSKTYTYMYVFLILEVPALCNIHHNYVHIETNKYIHQLDYRSLLNFAVDNMLSNRCASEADL